MSKGALQLALGTAGHGASDGDPVYSHAEHALTSPDGEHAVLHELGGDGPPLLLTHGNGLNAGMWAAVVPLLQSRFCCYGLDFRGHGASRPTRADFSVDRVRFVDEVLAAVDHIGASGPIAAAGHSLGGATLLRTEVDHPGTFAALWLFEPVLYPDTLDRPAIGDDHPLSIAARRRRQVFDSLDDALARFSSKPPFASCDPLAVRAYVRLGTYPQADGTVRLSCAGETEAAIFSSGAASDFSAFDNVGCQVTVAAGASIAPGNEFPPAMAPLIAAALRDGLLETFDNLTHFGPMEDPIRVANSILDRLS